MRVYTATSPKSDSRNASAWTERQSTGSNSGISPLLDHLILIPDELAVLLGSLVRD
ncbi:hypothetical protein GCM10009753_27640 [Streptantibioticus ferralitis]